MVTIEIVLLIGFVKKINYQQAKLVNKIMIVLLINVYPINVVKQMNQIKMVTMLIVLAVELMELVHHVKQDIT